jgi:hypothetical protein
MLTDRIQRVYYHDFGRGLAEKTRQIGILRKGTR